MTYSKEWDTAYQNGQRKQKTSPWTLTDMVGKFISTLQDEYVLELGCGAGANYEFMVNLGANYVGIDGSAEAIAEARQSFPEGKFLLGDFTKQIATIEGGFDLIFDRAAMAHNDTASIKAAVNGLWHALKPGGLYLGIDWFSTKHSEFSRGVAVDERTKTGYDDGQFVGIGKVHFTDEDELNDIFAMYKRAVLQERTCRRPRGGAFLKGIGRQMWISNAYDEVDYVSAVWDFIVKK